MIKAYRNINVESVSENIVVIDHTEKRSLHFDAVFNLMFGLLTILLILTYNHQDFSQLLITVSFVFIIFILNKYKYKIWQKRIIFDRTRGLIEIKQTIPYIDKTFNFNSVTIFPEDKKPLIKDKQTPKQLIYTLIIKEFGKKKQYIIYKTRNAAAAQKFKVFINNYMESDSLTLNYLQKYNRAEDVELHEVISL